MVQPVHTGAAPEKELMLSTLTNIADAVVSEGLASAAELEETVRQLRSYTDDPHSLVSRPRVFQVWGRRLAPARVP